MSNEENNFPIPTLIWRPGCYQPAHLPSLISAFLDALWSLAAWIGCQKHISNKATSSLFARFGLMFKIQVNSHGHVWTVSSTYYIFLGKLDQGINQYSAHTFVCIWQQSFLNHCSGGQGPREFFMINLQEIMGQGGDWTCDPWICSSTRICSQKRYRQCKHNLVH